MGGRTESTLEVISRHPPNKHAQKLLSGPLPFEITVSPELKEAGMQLTVNGRAELGGFF